MKYNLKILKENFDKNIINEGKLLDAAKSAKQFLSDYIKANPKKSILLTFQTMLSLGTLIARYILAGKDHTIITQKVDEFIAKSPKSPVPTADAIEQVKKIPDEKIVVQIPKGTAPTYEDGETPEADTQNQNSSNNSVNSELNNKIRTGEQLIQDLSRHGTVDYFIKISNVEVPLTELTEAQLQDMFLEYPEALNTFKKLGYTSLLVKSNSRSTMEDYNFTPDNSSEINSIFSNEVNLLDKDEFTKHITVSSPDGKLLYEFDLKSTSGMNISKVTTIENVIFHKENLTITNSEAIALATAMNEKAHDTEIHVDTGRASGAGTGDVSKLEEENINKSAESNNGIEEISNAIMNDSKKQLAAVESVIYNKNSKTSLVAHVAYYALKANGKLNKFLPNVNRNN